MLGESHLDPELLSHYFQPMQTGNTVEKDDSYICARPLKQI